MFELKCPYRWNLCPEVEIEMDLGVENVHFQDTEEVTVNMQIKVSMWIIIRVKDKDEVLDKYRTHNKTIIREDAYIVALLIIMYKNVCKERLVSK